MSWLGQHHQTRKVLIQGCHALFTANEKTIKWCRGELEIPPEKFKAEFKSLKPCFHGSDAHRLDKIGRPDKDRFCWIKADPTFEGLKQTLYEPRERVWIGAHPPRLKSDYQCIESIQFGNASSWFSSEQLPLNRDLVAVVGGRGAGKSALAELIAFAGGSQFFNSSDSKDAFLADTFIKKATTRSNTNPNPLVGATIQLRWADGQVDSVTLDSNLKHGREKEKVKYLPQKFVEGLCSPESTVDLQTEIERIIFQNLDDGHRSGAADFQDLRDQTTAGLSIRRKSHEQALQGLHSSIAQHSRKLGLKTARERELEEKRLELAALEKQLPSVPEELKAEIEKLEALTREKQTLEAEIGGLNSQLSQLEALEAKVELFGVAIAEHNAAVSRLLVGAGIVGADAVRFQVASPFGLADVIGGRRDVLRKLITEIREGVPDTSTANLRELDGKIETLRKELHAVEVQRQERERFMQRKSSLEATIRSLVRELQEIVEKTEPALGADIEARFDRYCDVLDLLLEEQRHLKDLYRPLQESLANADETAQKLAFHSQVAFDVDRAAARLGELLDQRISVRDQADIAQLLRRYFQELEDAIRIDEARKETFDRAAVKDALLRLNNSLTTSPDGSKTKRIEDQLKRAHTTEEYDSELFNPKWFRVSYALLFDGKRLELLSPGSRGIVLLLLYLEAERADSRPLIIDQPEDNLDNMSVYPSLVEYFRKRKQHRQIIIVTHNPNLVVNTDSEQVIVPSYDGSRVPRIVYRSGALENTTTTGNRGIRESVCKVLEGGHEAFRRREEKYALP